MRHIWLSLLIMCTLIACTLIACTSTATSPAASTEPPPVQTTVAATEPPPTETSTPEPTETPTQEWSIAFAVVDPASIDGGPRPIMTLHVIRADGTGLRPITSEIMNLNGLTASPDGQYLLFSANREDTSGDDFISWNDLGHLYVVEVQSGTIFTLTSGTETQEWKSGDWSPDEEYIAYGSERHYRREEMPHSLCVMRRDGTDNVCMPERDGLIWHVAWSPTGEQIAFERNGGIWIVNPDGSDLHKAADAQIAYSHVIYNARPTWSPDGKHIAFAAPGVGEEQKPDIFIVNPDGTGLQNFTQSPEQDFQPVWAPDGQHISYISGDWNLYISDLERNDIILLSDDSNPESYSPVWSPDGTQLLFVPGRTTQGDTQLFVTDWPGGTPRQLGEGLIVGDRPAWVILPQN